eukprot:gb/GECH01002374.1/.p1 GENE.gb/GECH01002374.1/~~gb/GECH01002374.1/.p1  ORF type:complete len:290 (+),score=37.90 gb/GECH01002374.1/:1-870(+)
MTLSEGEQIALEVIYVFVLVLSCISSAFLLATMIMFRERRKGSMKLVLFVSGSLFLRDITNILRWSDCTTIELLFQRYFGMAAYLWSGVYAFTIYMQLTARKKMKTYQSILAHVFCWVFPFLAVIIPFLAFINNMVYCPTDATMDEIRTEEPSRYNDYLKYNFTSGLLYLYPLAFVLAWNLWLFVQVLVEIKSVRSGASNLQTAESKKTSNKKHAKLYATMLVMFGLTYLMPLVNVLVITNDPNDTYFALYFFSAISYGIQNLLISFSYGFKKGIFKLWKDALMKRLGR